LFQAFFIFFLTCLKVFIIKDCNWYDQFILAKVFNGDVIVDQNCDMRDVLWLIRREGRQKQKILLPAIETTPEFKEKIDQRCRLAGLPYSAVVLHLLRIWMNQEIRLEPDPEFVASAREAFRSEGVQQSLRRLAEEFDPARIPG